MSLNQLLRALLLIFAVATPILGLNATAQSAPQTGPSSPAPIAALPSISLDSICTGAPVPSGWVRIDDMIDPSRCHSNLQYNVSMIQSLDGLPVGSSLEICTVVVVPLRWFMASSKWDPKKCGHPTSKTTDNVMIIKRAH